MAHEGGQQTLRSVIPQWLTSELISRGDSHDSHIVNLGFTENSLFADEPSNTSEDAEHLINVYEKGARLSELFFSFFRRHVAINQVIQTAAEVLDGRGVYIFGSVKDMVLAHGQLPIYPNQDLSYRFADEAVKDIDLLLPGIHDEFKQYAEKLIQEFEGIDGWEVDYDDTSEHSHVFDKISIYKVVENGTDLSQRRKVITIFGTEYLDSPQTRDHETSHLSHRAETFLTESEKILIGLKGGEEGTQGAFLYSPDGVVRYPSRCIEVDSGSVPAYVNRKMAEAVYQESTFEEGEFDYLSIQFVFRVLKYLAIRINFRNPEERTKFLRPYFKVLEDLDRYVKPVNGVRSILAAGDLEGTQFYEKGSSAVADLLSTPWRSEEMSGSVRFNSYLYPLMIPFIQHQMPFLERKFGEFSFLGLDFEGADAESAIGVARSPDGDIEADSLERARALLRLQIFSGLTGNLIENTTPIESINGYIAMLIFSAFLADYLNATIDSSDQRQAFGDHFYNQFIPDDLPEGLVDIDNEAGGELDLNENRWRDVGLHVGRYPQTEIVRQSGDYSIENILHFDTRFSTEEVIRRVQEAISALFTDYGREVRALRKLRSGLQTQEVTDGPEIYLASGTNINEFYNNPTVINILNLLKK